MYVSRWDFLPFVEHDVLLDVISQLWPGLLQDGPLLVDVAILGPCPAIALQIEEPGELAVNAPWLPLGSTRLKQQTLHSKGWQVQPLTVYQDTHAVQTGCTKQDAHLSSCIQPPT